MIVDFAIMTNGFIICCKKTPSHNREAYSLYGRESFFISADYCGHQSSGKISATKSKKHRAMCTSWPRICRICAFGCHEVQVYDDICTSWSELTHYPAVKTYVSETPYSHIWSLSVTPSTPPTTNTKAPEPALKPKIECNLLRESDIIKISDH